MTTGGAENGLVREVVAQIIDRVVAANANAAPACHPRAAMDPAPAYGPKARPMDPAPTYGPKAPSAPKARTTFPVRQRTYRDLVRRFFADEDRYDRLRHIVTTIPTVGSGSGPGPGSTKKNGRSACDRMCSIIFYFVKEFEPDRLVRTDAGIFRVCDEYNNAITNYKKRYYNFESKEGTGELVWKGEINPCVPVRSVPEGAEGVPVEDGGVVALPLPRLIALYWFIQFGFDRVFWERFDEVQARYEAFTARVKRKYTENHKTKKAERRRKIEQEVLEARARAEGPAAKTETQGQGQGQSCAQTQGQKLTRTERRLVAQKIEQEKRRRREMRAQKGGMGRGQKRKRKAGDSLEYKNSARRTSARTKEIGSAVLIEAIDGKNVALE